MSLLILKIDYFFNSLELEIALLSGQLALLQHGLVTEAQQLIEFTGYSDQEINQSQQDDPKGIKRGTPKKKSTCMKTEGGSPAEQIAKIKEFVAQTVAKKPLVKRAPTNTVESIRQGYIKAFTEKCKAAKCLQPDCVDSTWGKLRFLHSQLVYTIKSWYVLL